MAIPRGRIPLLAGGVALALAAAVAIQQRSAPAEKTDPNDKPPPVRQGGDPAAGSPSKPARQDRKSALRHLPTLPAPVVSPYPAGSPEYQEWMDDRIDALDNLSNFDDDETLAKILTELRNQVPEIRAAALKATKDFGSRAAIPYLEAISRDLQDPLEQKAIADVIERLKLPTILEQSDYDSID